MAKNWTVAEAIVALRSGSKADKQDIANRFPLTACEAFTEEGLLNIIKALPEKVTMRVIETALKDGVAPVEEAEEVAETPVAPEKEEKKPAKRSAKAKKEELKEETVEEVDEWGEEEPAKDELESKSAKELYEMCKEKGISCKPKMNKEVYIEALRKAEEPEEADDDDWDEEEEEEKPAPKASAKKKPEAKKPAAKKAPAKKAEPEEDEEEDWEI